VLVSSQFDRGSKPRSPAESLARREVRRVGQPALPSSSVWLPSCFRLWRVGPCWKLLSPPYPSKKQVAREGSGDYNDWCSPES
jgi:hypothetical protein